MYTTGRQSIHYYVYCRSSLLHIYGSNTTGKVQYYQGKRHTYVIHALCVFFLQRRVFRVVYKVLSLCMLCTYNKPRTLIVFHVCKRINVTPHKHNICYILHVYGCQVFPDAGRSVHGYILSGVTCTRNRISHRILLVNMYIRVSKHVVDILITERIATGQCFIRSLLMYMFTTYYM